MAASPSAPRQPPSTAAVNVSVSVDNAKFLAGTLMASVGGTVSTEIQRLDLPLSPADSRLAPGAGFVTENKGNLALYWTGGLAKGSTAEELHLLAASSTRPLTVHQEECASVAAEVVIQRAISFLDALDPGYMLAARGAKATLQRQSEERFYRHDGRAVGAPGESTASRLQSQLVVALRLMYNSAAASGNGRWLEPLHSIFQLADRARKSADENVSDMLLRKVSMMWLAWLESRQATTALVRCQFLRRRSASSEDVLFSSPSFVKDWIIKLLHTTRLLAGSLSACEPEGFVPPSSLQFLFGSKPELYRLPGVQLLAAWSTIAKEVCSGEEARTLVFSVTQRTASGEPCGFLFDGRQLNKDDISVLHNTIVLQAAAAHIRALDALLAEQPDSKKLQDLRKCAMAVQQRRGKLEVIVSDLGVTLRIDDTIFRDDLPEFKSVLGAATVEGRATAAHHLCVSQRLAKIALYLGGGCGGRGTEIESLEMAGIVHVPSLPFKGELHTAPRGVLGRLAVTVCTEKFRASNPVRFQVLSEGATEVALVHMILTRPALLALGEVSNGHAEEDASHGRLQRVFVPSRSLPLGAPFGNEAVSTGLRRVSESVLQREVLISDVRTMTDLVIAHHASQIQPTSARTAALRAQARSKGHSQQTLEGRYLVSGKNGSRVPSTANGDLLFSAHFEDVFEYAVTAPCKLVDRAGLPKAANRPQTPEEGFEWLHSKTGQAVIVEALGDGRQPHSWQEHVWAQLMARRHVLTCIDVGGGKTACAMFVALAVRALGVRRTTVVTAPLVALVNQWHGQALAAGLRSIIVGGDRFAVSEHTVIGDLNRAEQLPDVIITTFDRCLTEGFQALLKCLVTKELLEAVVVDEAEELLVNTYRPIFDDWTAKCAWLPQAGVMMLGMGGTILPEIEAPLLKVLGVSADGAFVVRHHLPKPRVLYGASTASDFAEAVTQTSALVRQCFADTDVWPTIGRRIRTGMPVELPPGVQAIVFCGTKRQCIEMAEVLHHKLMQDLFDALPGLDLTVLEGSGLPLGRLAAPCFSNMEGDESIWACCSASTIEDAVRAYRLPVVCATTRLSQGFHHAGLATCVTLAPDSKNLLVQQFGRVGREASDRPSKAHIVQYPCWHGRDAESRGAAAGQQASKRQIAMPTSSFYTLGGVKDLVRGDECFRKALFHELHGSAALSCKELQGILSKTSAPQEVVRYVFHSVPLVATVRAQLHVLIHVPHLYF